MHIQTTILNIPEEFKILNTSSGEIKIRQIEKIALVQLKTIPSFNTLTFSEAGFLTH